MNCILSILRSNTFWTVTTTIFSVLIAYNGIEKTIKEQWKQVNAQLEADRKNAKRPFFAMRDVRLLSVDLIPAEFDNNHVPIVDEGAIHEHVFSYDNTEWKAIAQAEPWMCDISLENIGDGLASTVSYSCTPNTGVSFPPRAYVECGSNYKITFLIDPSQQVLPCGFGIELHYCNILGCEYKQYLQIVADQTDGMLQISVGDISFQIS